MPWNCIIMSFLVGGHEAWWRKAVINHKKMGRMVSALPQQPDHSRQVFKTPLASVCFIYKMAVLSYLPQRSRREDLVKTTFYILCRIL